jgi:hypothetical protein
VVKNGFCFLFPVLEEWIPASAGMTTRATGESPAPFAVRPYSPVTGDSPVCVHPRFHSFVFLFFLIREIRS